MVEELNSIKSSSKELKNFGVTIGFILLMIGVFLFVIEKDLFIYFFSIGLILIIIGGIAPVILRPIYKIWMIFAVIIGWGNDESNFECFIFFNNYYHWNLHKINWKRFFKFEVKKSEILLEYSR